MTVKNNYLSRCRPILASNPVRVTVLRTNFFFTLFLLTVFLSTDCAGFTESPARSDDLPTNFLPSNYPWSKTPKLVERQDGNVTDLYLTDPELAKIRTDLGLLRSKPRTDDRLVIDWIVQQKDALPPPYLFELGRRMLSLDAAKALEWHLVAIARTLYDAARCKDRSARGGIGLEIQRVPETISFISKNQDQYDEAMAAVMNRPDLLAGQASPWWLCSQGKHMVATVMDGKSIPRDNWLIPETEWPGIRERFLQAQKKDQKSIEEQRRNTIAELDGHVRVHTVFESEDSADIGDFSWFKAGQLVYEKRVPASGYDDLVLWQPDQEPKRLSRSADQSFWCAGEGNLFRIVEVQAKDESAPRTALIEHGPVESLFRETIALDGNLPFTNLVRDGGLSTTNNSGKWLLSGIDCHLVSSRRLLKKYGPSSISILKKGDGFIAFDWRDFSFGDGSTAFYHADASADAVPLAMTWPALRQECVSYDANRKAYFVSPCARGRRRVTELFKQQPCIPAWWVRPGKGVVEQQCEPRGNLRHSDYYQLPWKGGVLRLVPDSIHQGDKNIGIFVRIKGGEWRKIYSFRFVGSWNVSPDGCMIALEEFRGGHTYLNVIELCAETLLQVTGVATSD